MENKILVTRSSMPDFEEYIAEIREMWDTHWLTNMGVKHQTLERQLQEYLGSGNVCLFTNGHMALELALQAMELTGEVITTPFTFASTTHAIVRNGLTPVFCDIDAEDFTMDINCLEKLITPRTCAIVPVHVYGNVCKVEEIKRIAERHGLRVIYDAAHAFGVTYQGKGIATWGDASMFSFHATKVFNTIEGGAVCYGDDALSMHLNELKNFGIHGPESVENVGANAKMSEFQAAMGICNLRHIQEEIQKRRAVTERYRSHLEGVPGLQLNPVQQDVEQNYSYFPVVFHKDVFGADRDQVFDVLEQKGIGARKYFYPLASEFACYRNRYHAEDTPVAQRISRSVLTLPLYADLALSDVDRICRVVLDCRTAR